MRARSAPTLVLLAALWLAGCVAVPAAAQDTTQPRTCGRDAGLEPGTHDLSLKVGNDTRESLLYVPASAGKAAKVALVVVLHGGGGSGKNVQRQSRMNAVADANGFIVAYPDGTKGRFGHTWNGGDCCGVAMRENVDDVAFLRALIDMLIAQHCVDPARVFITGISNGAIMAYRMACEAADKVAAIAPVAGAPMTTSPCRPSRPVPTIVFHGTADTSVRVEGGFNKPSDPRRAFPPLAETLDGLIASNECSKTPRTTYRKGDATCVSYGPCAPDAQVEYCKIDGGGHTWPGGVAMLERIVGPTSKDISASEVMWKFFERHPMKGGSR
jgi:polyhydroxybutyrate depolymerase